MPPAADQTAQSGSGRSFSRLLIRPAWGGPVHRQAKANNTLGPSQPTPANGKLIKVLVWKLCIQSKKSLPRILLLTNTHTHAHTQCIYVEFSSTVKATHSRNTLLVINWPADTFMHLQLHSYCVNTRVLQIGRSVPHSNTKTLLHRVFHLFSMSSFCS